MRLLINEKGNKAINIDAIKNVCVQKIINDNNTKYVLSVDNLSLYVGDSKDVAIRYNNLIHCLLDADTPGSMNFIGKNSILKLKKDGTYENAPFIEEDIRDADK